MVGVMKQEKVILVDCDGVLLDWLFSFEVWMEEQGHIIHNESSYDISIRYDINRLQADHFVETFNESATIGFLPPFRDAMHYVGKLHREHGFVFHCITSMGSNVYARRLRRKNLRDLFGKSTFFKFTFLEMRADKRTALSKYKNTGCFWIEDYVDNAIAGRELGLKPILLAHDYNLKADILAKHKIPRVKSWKEVYDMIVDWTAE